MLAQAGRVCANGTIDLGEIARPEILDAGRISGTIVANLSK